MTLHKESMSAPKNVGIHPPIKLPIVKAAMTRNLGDIVNYNKSIR